MILKNSVKEVCIFKTFEPMGGLRAPHIHTHTMGSGAKGGDSKRKLTNTESLKMGLKTLCLMVKKFMMTMGLLQTDLVCI